MDCCDAQGQTPLHALAGRGQHSLLSEVLARGAASLNAQDAEGHTALHHAASCGGVGACRVLRAAGADLCVRSAGGQTAKEVAELGGHQACLHLLI